MSQQGNSVNGHRKFLGERYDAVICGASFAGLTAARELAGSGARVLVLDRYAIGERPTSACGIPTDWLQALDMIDLELQRFGELVVHTPGAKTVLDLPYCFSTFDYDEVCVRLWSECDAEFEVAAVSGRRTLANGDVEVETDRGTVVAPLVVDALGWRRMLASGDHFQPVEAPLTRALEVHPAGHSEDLEVWVDRRYARAGYGWCFPAGEERRIGACSYEPVDHVRKGTDRIAADLGGADRAHYQGNWIPHKLRPPTEGGVFFAGDSAGQCLALTAEGIRTALYFGLAAGRELRAVYEGWQTRDEALSRYSEFGEAHRRGFGVLLFFQRLVPRIPVRLLRPAFRIYKTQFLIDFTFKAYLRIAPPEFVELGGTDEALVAARSAHDEKGAGEQQGDAQQPLGTERDFVQAK
jgi:flavin-dependent dehydrogenase